MRFSRKEILISAGLIIILFSYYLYSNAAWKNLDESFNPEREKLGVPLIEPYFLANDKKDMWYNPDTTPPRHAMKAFSIRTQSKTVEQDNFEVLVDGRKETVYCYYHYNRNCFSLYFGAKKITCSEFNTLLKENGLSFQLTKCKECEEK